MPNLMVVLVLLWGRCRDMSNVGDVRLRTCECMNVWVCFRAERSLKRGPECCVVVVGGRVGVVAGNTRLPSLWCPLSSPAPPNDRSRDAHTILRLYSAALHVIARPPPPPSLPPPPQVPPYLSTPGPLHGFMYSSPHHSAASVQANLRRSPYFHPHQAIAPQPVCTDLGLSCSPLVLAPS